MSQESFVLVKDLNFNDAGVQAKTGDVLVFTPPERLVIYRAGDLIARIGFHKVSLDGLVLSGILLTEKKAQGLKATITPDPADEETGIGPVNPPPPPPKKAEAPVEKTEEVKAPEVKTEETAGDEKKPEAGEQQVKKTEEPKAAEVKVEEPKAEKKAEAKKPEPKAAEPAKKPKK